MIFQCGPPGQGELMAWRRQQEQDQEQAQRDRDRAQRPQQSLTHHQFPDTRGGGGLKTLEQQMAEFKAVAMDHTKDDDVRQRALEQQVDLWRKKLEQDEKNERQTQKKLKAKDRSKGRRCINITRIANAVQCHS